MIGKWNKSVIITYIGMTFSVLGMGAVLLDKNIKYAFICLMFAGICDLFDGTIARMCKRTKEEKAFGIELDSLVDVFSFVAFPIVILMKIGHQLYYLPIAVIYAIFGVARLAYFNINTADENKAVKYYTGLPVTVSALIFPLIYLLSYLIKDDTFTIIYNIVALLVAILFVLKFKIKKPNVVSSIILFLIAVVVTIVLLVS